MLANHALLYWLVKPHMGITGEDLIKVWERQNGHCLLTAIPMQQEVGHPNAPDLILHDHHKGYSLDNLSLVCEWVSRAKGVMSLAAFKDILDSLDRFRNYRLKASVVGGEAGQYLQFSNSAQDTASLSIVGLFFYNLYDWIREKFWTSCGVTVELLLHSNGGPMTVIVTLPTRVTVETFDIMITSNADKRYVISHLNNEVTVRKEKALYEFSVLKEESATVQPEVLFQRALADPQCYDSLKEIITELITKIDN